MSQELFNQLDQKVAATVETMERLKLENEALQEENKRLKQEREEWEQRLSSLLSKFDKMADTPVTS